MFIQLIFYVSLWLVSAALATPSFRSGEPVAFRREDDTSQLSTRSSPSISPSTNWAGAGWSQSDGTFTTVSGTFALTTPLGNLNSSAGTWLGIDGFTCPSATLHVGVVSTVEPDGPTYGAWYQLVPDIPRELSGITFNAGDVVVATVTAFSTTFGTVVVENQSSGEIVTQDVTSTSPFCMKDAVWVVKDTVVDGKPLPLANFGNVTIGDAGAFGPSGKLFTLSGATPIEIEGITEVTVDGESNSVTIEFTG